MASPTVASPTRASPADIPTAAPSSAPRPRRLASAPPAVYASASSSPASAYSGDQLSAPDASSPLLASRSEEYRLLFRLPPDEGHMYLFLHHICFYSNIFGYETKKTIPLQEVTDVRKAKTAAIFSNAIEIVAGSRRHFFGSFLSRDEAYQIIVDGWEQHVSNARLLLERQETKSASSSEENGYVLLEGAKEPKQDEDSSPLDRSVNSTAVSSGSADGGDSNINISRRFSNVEENGLEDNIITLNPFNLEPVDDTPSVPESYTSVTESKFQVPVEVLFNLLLSDGAFGFLDDFHKNCGDKEFSCSKWRTDEQGGLVRDVSFLHPIKIYLGAKFGTCQEVQKLRLYKNRRLVIQTSQSIGKIEQSTKDECREVFSLWIKLGHDLLKQEYDRSKGTSSTTDSGAQSGAITNEENTGEVAVPMVSTSQDVSGARSLIPPFQDPQQRTGRDSSIGSTSQELWGSLTSHMRSSQLGPVTIIVLLTRSPQVQMAPHGISTGSFGYSKESMEWAQKRLSLLREEMQVAEAHMERMRHEFAWLRSYLEGLERLRRRT
ncbi:Protein VASCULAR ASSOCIATED DEATH 1 chloroplastic [Zea mays]|uniref:Protein VASCULAR ASSOCIATED DEATH 1 chloroplastic n=1 Tax=Zea mays TaxID=4577 RepID=A0A1D6EVZ8_MAIZE|nr:Protein VASCULAR ASSOCIATED DEATH 1 chloroplastic [Zea mays]